MVLLLVLFYKRFKTVLNESATICLILKSHVTFYSLKFCCSFSNDEFCFIISVMFLCFNVLLLH